MLTLLLSYLVAAPVSNPSEAQIHTEDLDHFFEALQAHREGMPLRRALRIHYRRPGSAGLDEAWKINIRGVGRLARRVESSLPYYEGLEGELALVEGEMAEIRGVFSKLEELYPQAVHPDVYLVVGRFNSAGTLSDEGLFISLEMFGRNLNPDLAEGSWLDRVLKPTGELDAIVAHELAHYQQHQTPQNTLEACLLEGVADVLAEELSGRHTNPSVYAFGAEHHDEVWTAFVGDMHGSSTRDWLYRTPAREGWPQDLGYYAGYHIATGYLEHASSREQGLRELLEWTDSEQMLRDSGRLVE